MRHILRKRNLNRVVVTKAQDSVMPHAATSKTCGWLIVTKPSSKETWQCLSTLWQCDLSTHCSARRVFLRSAHRSSFEAKGTSPQPDTGGAGPTRRREHPPGTYSADTSCQHAVIYSSMSDTCLSWICRPTSLFPHPGYILSCDRGGKQPRPTWSGFCTGAFGACGRPRGGPLTRSPRVGLRRTDGLRLGYRGCGGNQ